MSALTQRELAELLGGSPPKEAMYRVIVDLQARTIHADGKAEPLKPGMALGRRHPAGPPAYPGVGVAEVKSIVAREVNATLSASTVIDGLSWII